MSLQQSNKQKLIAKEYERAELAGNIEEILEEQLIEQWVNTLTEEQIKEELEKYSGDNMNSKLVNTVSFHGTSPVYNVLNSTRKLRLMNKLNKHCSFHRGLQIDKQINRIFNPINRSRKVYLLS